MTKQLHKDVHYTPRTWLLIAKTGVLLFLIRIGLSLFSFNKVRHFLDWFAETFPGHQAMSEYSQERIIWAVNIVGAKLLGDNPCLPQALAVQMLFKRRRVASVLRIGVRKGTAGELQAHAWIEKDGKIVIGGTDSPEEYVPLPSLD